MMKTLLSATAMAMLIAGGAAAQQTATDPVRTPATRSDTTVTRTPVTAAATTQQPGQIDSEKLVGTDIHNAEGNEIGEIKSVMLGPDGKVDSVIVGVGGFLGMGEREVALKWSDLNVSDNGRKVVANYSKDQLKAMPEFKYADNQRRGGVFTRDGGPARHDTVTRTETTTTTARTDSTAPATTAAPMTVTRSSDTTVRSDARPGTTAAAHNDATDSLGQLSADKIIGQNVVNARGENIGEVEDLVLDRNKKVFAVIGVGGFLGMGDRDVAVPFDQLKLGDNKMIMLSEASKDKLKGLPEYKKDGYSKYDRPGPVTTTR
jgi:sporulation protein YlmC with PRC-barrel domain